MKIKTGGMDLLESETFLAIADGETVIAIGEDPDWLHFVLKFVEVKGKKEATLEYKAVEGHTLNVTLINWNSPLGITIFEPCEVGTYCKRRLFMLFNIRRAGEEGHFREVTFSLYLGEEVQDGKN